MNSRTVTLGQARLLELGAGLVDDVFDDALEQHEAEEPVWPCFCSDGQLPGEQELLGAFGHDVLVDVFVLAVPALRVFLGHDRDQGRQVVGLYEVCGGDVFVGGEELVEVTVEDGAGFFLGASGCGVLAFLEGLELVLEVVVDGGDALGEAGVPARRS